MNDNYVDKYRIYLYNYICGWWSGSFIILCKKVFEHFQWQIQSTQTNWIVWYLAINHQKQKVWRNCFWSKQSQKIVWNKSNSWEFSLCPNSNLTRWNCFTSFWVMQKRVKKKKATSIVRFVVLGGGVAAVACAQQLAKLSSTQSQAFCSEITLISASMLLKEVFHILK